MSYSMWRAPVALGLVLCGAGSLTAWNSTTPVQTAAGAAQIRIPIPVADTVLGCAGAGAVAGLPAAGAPQMPSDQPQSQAGLEQPPDVGILNATAFAAPPAVSTYVNALGAAGEPTVVRPVMGIVHETPQLYTHEQMTTGVRLDYGAQSETSFAVAVPSLGATSAAAAGVVFAEQPQGSGSGLGAAGCSRPSADTWLIGGATTTGSATSLEIINPGPTPATISVQVHSDVDTFSPAALQNVSIPAFGALTHSLGASAAGLQTVAVHVQASQGTVTAALATRTADGEVPRGFDLVGHAPPASTEVHIPLIVKEPPRPEYAAFPESVVRVVNPSPQATSVSLLARTIGGQSVDLGLLAEPLEPLSVVDIQLPENYPLGVSSLVISATAPVVAAARVVVPMGDVTPEDTDVARLAADAGIAATASEIAWSPGVPSLPSSPTDMVVAVRPEPGSETGVFAISSVGSPATVVAVHPDGSERSFNVGDELTSIPFEDAEVMGLYTSSGSAHVVVRRKSPAGIAVSPVGGDSPQTQYLQFVDP